MRFYSMVTLNIWQTVNKLKEQAGGDLHSFRAKLRDHQVEWTKKKKKKPLQKPENAQLHGWDGWNVSAQTKRFSTCFRCCALGPGHSIWPPTTLESGGSKITILTDCAKMCQASLPFWADNPSAQWFLWITLCNQHLQDVYLPIWQAGVHPLAGEGGYVIKAV